VPQSSTFIVSLYFLALSSTLVSNLSFSFMHIYIFFFINFLGIGFSALACSDMQDGEQNFIFAERREVYTLDVSCVVLLAWNGPVRPLRDAASM